MKRCLFGLATVLVVGFPGVSSADDIIAAGQFDGARVGFLLQGKNHNATLTIAGPNGFHVSTFSKSGAVAIDLHQFGAIDDGTYTYQLTAATDEAVKNRAPLDNGRDRSENPQPVKDAVTSGTFRVVNGAIVKPNAVVQTSRKDSDAR